MLRARRGRVYGIGPRSAHIAGLAYASYTPVGDLDGATVEVGAPLADDPADYVWLRIRDGSRVAITTTCAANLVGITEPDDYCYADPAAARRAFEIVAATSKLDAETIATHMLTAASDEVCELALAVASSSKLKNPALIGVGGGAGGLARYVAARLGWSVTIPPHAEVISSIGDALSLLRAEKERTAESADQATLESMMAEVEAEVVAAGASPATVEVRVEEVPERSTLRAIATGAVGLATGAVPGRVEVGESVRELAPRGASVTQAGRFWLVHDGGTVAVLDRYGDEVVTLRGEESSAAELDATVARHVRYRGPITLRPTVWIVDGNRFLELVPTSAGANPYAGRADVTYLVGRPR